MADDPQKQTPVAQEVNSDHPDSAFPSDEEPIYISLQPLFEALGLTWGSAYRRWPHTKPTADRPPIPMERAIVRVRAQEEQASG